MEYIYLLILLSVIIPFGDTSNEYVQVSGSSYTSVSNKNYEEKNVTARSILDCSIKCIQDNHCEAIVYESLCMMKLFNISVLYPLVLNTSLSASGSELYIQKHDRYFIPSSEYIFESSLNFWYKFVESPQLTASQAKEACNNEGAYLLLIDNDYVFNFTVNLLAQKGVKVIYLQGYRQSVSDSYLDEDGIRLTYFQWNSDGVNGPGLYLRTSGQTTVMETSGGSLVRSYVCQLRLN